MILNTSNYLDINLKGKIIIFPTDTVYGIGCLYDDLEAVKRIFEIKQRDYSKPMAILCSTIGMVKNVVDEDTVLDKKLIEYWPGKLTLIFKKNKNISDIITANKDSVGVRIPNHEISLNLLKKFGPMVVTSLNLSSEPAIIKFDNVLKYETRVDYIVDGGDLNSEASTVYDTINKITLRQGDIIIK
ncbi:MAG: L-threonylcarbamoyladenylate synthase [Candidatus Izemoplasmatales bacterium]|nr:L-threonylcarbamoyladenylate synthase [Candidatus Izemoplasmatales bacterium]